MFADQQDTIDSQFFAPEGECCFYVFVQWNVARVGHGRTDTSSQSVRLVDEHRGHVDPRLDQSVIGREAFEEFDEQDIRMRERVEGSDDGGDFWAVSRHGMWISVGSPSNNEPGFKIHGPRVAKKTMMRMAATTAPMMAMVFIIFPARISASISRSASSFRSVPPMR